MPGEFTEGGGYHYYPPRDRVLGWLAAAGFTVTDQAVHRADQLVPSGQLLQPRLQVPAHGGRAGLQALVAQHVQNGQPATHAAGLPFPVALAVVTTSGTTPCG